MNTIKPSYSTMYSEEDARRVFGDISDYLTLESTLDSKIFKMHGMDNVFEIIYKDIDECMDDKCIIAYVVMRTKVLYQVVLWESGDYTEHILTK